MRWLRSGRASSWTSLTPDFKYKPEGMDQNTAPSSSKGASSNAATMQHQMSIDEAHLILNVKKEDPMEIIQKVSLGSMSLPNVDRNAG